MAWTRPQLALNGTVFVANKFKCILLGSLVVRSVKVLGPLVHYVYSIVLVSLLLIIMAKTYGARALVEVGNITRKLPCIGPT